MANMRWNEGRIQARILIVNYGNGSAEKVYDYIRNGR